MVKGLSFSELYSHLDPKKFLEEHLKNVALLAAEIIESKIFNLPEEKKDKIKKTCFISGICHDLGKSTAYFQNYLFADEKEKNKLKNQKETKHGLLSAVISFFAVKEEFKNEGENLFPFISYLAVKKHHGNLKDVMEEVVISEKELELLKNQAKSIDDKKFEILATNLKECGFNILLTKSLVFRWIEDLPGELRRIKMKLRDLDSNDFSLYLTVNLIYSTLIDADKTDVVVGEKRESASLEFDEQNVVIYKKSKSFPKNTINSLREEAFNDVLNNEMDLNNKIYSINLPTGMGKTLTSLAFAFKLRKKYFDRYGVKPRIIYALPFLSIIEQNGKIIEELLITNSIHPYSDIFLKHHHLTEISYITEKEEYEGDKAEFLIESWDSQIIITTFVQFFNAIISNKNSALRRFNKVLNSIIIIDEIQAIPVKYLKLIEKIILELVEKFNTYVIISSATTPILFENKISRLNKERYFKILDRVKMNINIDKKLGLKELLENLTFEKEKSYLFIFNTIKCAREFYGLLKQKFPKEEIEYLSTHVTPKERLERIEKIKRKKIKFAVTTQLVEAGVDIDFDVVYRDFAPLDSLIQSAGRCNRNNTNTGEVNLVYLQDDNSRSFASYIYDSILLEITLEILKKYVSVSEKEFNEILKKYYSEVSNRKSFRESDEILRAVGLLNYENSEGAISISDFKLIEEDLPKMEVFVEIDDESKKLWEDYVQLKNIKNIFERREKFNKFKSDFYKYVISIPLKTENMPPIVEGFGYINKNSLRQYYDNVTGFKCEGEVAIW
ncbi:CRISPR-associated helicase Cas3' [Thermovenabulum sp.]|uniref:CRISPR-associated helicase Cas3' n=1 Tax=Thermovenabulum sp. TaxID=3100335 RepID=UPI003C7D39B0